MFTMKLPQQIFIVSPFRRAIGQAEFMRFFEKYGVMLNNLAGNIVVPRHAGSFAVFALIGGIACFGMVAGGHTLETLKLTSAGLGLGVNKVEISGNKHVSEIDILQALGLDGDMSLPVLNAADARTRLQALPWVEKVSVRKIYPDRLIVKLVERKPYAVWQKNGVVDIVDNEGRIIVPYTGKDGHGLPFFVGRGAADNAQEFLRGIQKFPDLAGRARAFIRVADRRWDILLDNGLRIKLPEKAPFVRLALAEKIDRTQGLFNRDITDLDLRLEDRITVALGPEAMARRDKEVKEAEKREKALKNGGQA